MMLVIFTIFSFVLLFILNLNSGLSFLVYGIIIYSVGQCFSIFQKNNNLKYNPYYYALSYNIIFHSIYYAITFKNGFLFLGIEEKFFLTWPDEYHYVLHSLGYADRYGVKPEVLFIGEIYRYVSSHISSSIFDLRMFNLLIHSISFGVLFNYLSGLLERRCVSNVTVSLSALIFVYTFPSVFVFKETIVLSAFAIGLVSLLSLIDGEERKKDSRIVYFLVFIMCVWFLYNARISVLSLYILICIFRLSKNLVGKNLKITLVLVSAIALFISSRIDFVSESLVETTELSQGFFTRLVHSSYPFIRFIFTPLQVFNPPLIANNIISWITLSSYELRDLIREFFSFSNMFILNIIILLLVSIRHIPIYLRYLVWPAMIFISLLSIAFGSFHPEVVRYRAPATLMLLSIFFVTYHVNKEGILQMFRLNKVKFYLLNALYFSTVFYFIVMS